jgi:hypothetical protein
MNSMAIRRCKNAVTVHSKGEYREPIVIILPILNHKNGHDVKPNKVALKYPDFKKDINPNYVHVKMFNFVIKANAKTSLNYIINAFSSTLKDMTLD